MYFVPFFGQLASDNQVPHGQGNDATAGGGGRDPVLRDAQVQAVVRAGPQPAEKGEERSKGVSKFLNWERDIHVRINDKKYISKFGT